MTYDFTDAVLARPKMYTLNGSYQEVVAFLEGYYSGVAKGRIGLSVVENWSVFREWLAKRLNVLQSNELRILADLHGNTALDALNSYYNEFKTSKYYLQASPEH